MRSLVTAFAVVRRIAVILFPKLFIIRLAKIPPLLGSIYYCYLFLGAGSPFNQPVFFITIFFSYWLIALVGVPAVVMFKSQKALDLKVGIFWGMSVGLLTAFLLFAFSSMFPPLSQLVIFGFMGVIAGVAVWYVFK